MGMTNVFFTSSEMNTAWPANSMSSMNIATRFGVVELARDELASLTLLGSGARGRAS